MKCLRNQPKIDILGKIPKKVCRVESIGMVRPLQKSAKIAIFGKEGKRAG